MTLSINPPNWDIMSNPEKMQYLLRARELLRKLHNVMGDWFRDGITQAKYDKFPAKVRNRYSFTLGVKLTKVQWDDFLSGWAWGFMPLVQKINQHIGVQKQIAFDDSGVDVDLVRDITE